MALLSKVIKVFEGALTATPNTVVYTVPGGKNVLVTAVNFCNTHATAVRAVFLRAGTAPISWIDGAPTIPAGAPLPLFPHQILAAGDTVQAWQDAGTDVHLTITGLTEE